MRQYSTWYGPGTITRWGRVTSDMGVTMMKVRRFGVASLSVALGAAALVAGSGDVGVAHAEPGLLEVPAPVVQGPIPSTVQPPGTPRDYPFMATPIDLAARGYVEEEYFISRSDACAYTGVGSGPATVPAVCDGSYTTRIMVRRPLSDKAFNGTVLLEWQNVTAQYDVDHYWHESSEHIIREGYAWVGVSAQRAGVNPNFPCIPTLGVFVGCNNLRTWSPLRYGNSGGNLNIPNDNLSFDIFSHAAQALRNPDPAGPAPMGDLEVATVIALGTSQSAGRLNSYHNSIYPLQADPVIDAFFLGESRTNLRTDLDVPVLRLLSEVDVAASYAPADADNYRHWEVAGASHADAGFTDKIQGFIDQGLILQTPPVCTRNAPSQIPKRYAYHAAWDHMVRWVNDGVLPPIAPRIQWVDGAIVRDTLGNAKGGIALSEHAVATAYNGTGNGGGIFCNLFGVHEPFTPEQLRQLYRNQGAYVSAVARVNNGNRQAGYIVAADSAESTRLAAQSGVGRR
ncbi:MAG TPA: alpha/beta hydrolase domain-containing protein [Ilumatobacteraceae bacterium]|nr:alpha/beta hydrolase domain-containing protein [Ilumatobacteraceae bacterium]